MCEMCEAACDVLKPEIWSGWHVVRAARDGEYMKEGQLGLVHANNPTIFWTPHSSEWESYNEMYDKRWKELRRKVLKHGVFGRDIVYTYSGSSIPKGNDFASFLISEIENDIFNVDGNDRGDWIIDVDPQPWSAGSPLGKSLLFEEAKILNEEFKKRQIERKRREDLKWATDI